jgi:hypothetical protein
MKMKFTEQDFKEVQEFAIQLTTIDNIDAAYVDKVSSELFIHQPFFLSVLMGYREDISMEELDEIVKIYFLIWAYFKQNKNVHAKKVTTPFFETIQNRKIQMLQYVSGETDEQEKMKIYCNDLQQLTSKALLTAVFYRYNNRPVLLRMDTMKKSLIFLDINSFIECFETI